MKSNPYSRSEIKTFAVPSGQFEFDKDNIFTGEVPTKVVGILSAGTYDGQWDTNCFNCQHYNVTYAAFSVDNKSLPGDPLTPNFAQNNYATAYNILFTDTGMDGKDRGNYITRAEYPHGFCIYIFDVSDITIRVSHLQRGDTPGCTLNSLRRYLNQSPWLCTHNFTICYR